MPRPSRRAAPRPGYDLCEVGPRIIFQEPGPNRSPARVTSSAGKSSPVGGFTKWLRRRFCPRNTLLIVICKWRGTRRGVTWRLSDSGGGQRGELLSRIPPYIKRNGWPVFPISVSTFCSVSGIIVRSSLSYFHDICWRR